MNSYFEKVTFVLSLMVFSLLYGVGVGKYSWFPYHFLDQAADQARTVYDSAFEGNLAVSTGPRVYDRTGVRTAMPEKMSPGVTLISSAWEDTDGWNSELRLIDSQGEVLHRWKLDRGKVFQNNIDQRKDPSGAGVHGSYLLPGGDAIMNLHYVGMVRFNSCGDVLWEIPEGNHHSVARADDGSFWASGTSSERRMSTTEFPSGFPGIEQSVWLDQIVHISEEGDVSEKINVLGILYENELERYLVKSVGPYPDGKINRDPVHINDIEPLDPYISQEYPLFDAGDLVVSLRHPSLVFVLDPISRKVKWHASEPFIHQHDPDFIGGGWIGVFDNNVDLAGRDGNGDMLGGSQIVAIQPHTDSTRILFQGKHLKRFYTAVEGKWQMLENGNMLLAESKAGRVVEVDSKGRLVWEWINVPVDSSRTPSVTKATRVDVTREEVASWPCSSINSVDESLKKN